jgi:predicted metalloprotease with PDZ domain
MPTPWLWVSEGITDYYADLAEVRGGVVDEAGFLALTAGKIREVRDTPPVALEDASLSTWIHPVDGTGYTYYPKGSLAGFLLDVLIRDASDNRRSLDDVMRDLYRQDYKAGRGFTGEEWWAAVGRAMGGKPNPAVAASLDEIRERWINGRDPFPWDRLLPLAALRAISKPEPRLGVATEPDSSGAVIVTRAEPLGAAARAGIRPGDVLIAVGEIPVSDVQFAERFRARYGSAAEGSPLPIRVRRGGQTLTLQSALTFAPGDVRLERLPGASAKAVRVLEGIVKGKG